MKTKTKRPRKTADQRKIEALEKTISEMEAKLAAANNAVNDWKQAWGAQNDMRMEAGSKIDDLQRKNKELTRDIEGLKEYRNADIQTIEEQRKAIKQLEIENHELRRAFRAAFVGMVKCIETPKADQPSVHHMASRVVTEPWLHEPDFTQ